MLALITQMEPWHWVALGVALLAIEVLVGTELLLGLGLGALAVALVYKLSPELSWQMQFVWFAVLSVAFTFVYWKLFRAEKVQSDQPLLNNRTQQLVGKTAPVVVAIENGRGKVQIADALWAAEGPDCDVGTPVVVVAAEGMTLQVKRQDS